MRRVLTLVVVLALAACGGASGSRGDRSVARAMPVAAGPISTACLQSDRKARSRVLCGCIQVAANRTLSRAEQRRAVRFYRDPHSAQDIRQSRRPVDQRFWKAYRAYGAEAERLCS